ncbi:MAG: SDR family NAD(P)-dependent oxidoreductase [Armatimonadota bacterium]|nr:MAG: SDR family NAD(P)-dependent oxidoreductase [Armatimonadota bacterium]
MAGKQDATFDISGKVVAVTGAAGVIYGTIAKGLAARGAKVALLDLLGDKAAEIADEIKSEGGEAVGLTCDVLDPTSISGALDGILKRYGRVDVLINGAGGNRPGATVQRDAVFTDLALDEVDKVFALNYRGTFLPTQVFCKYFAQQGRGVVVNTSSMCSFAPLTNVPGYSNAKAAVTNFTQWLAVQVKVDYPDAEIRVNEVAPGFLDTTQNHRLLFEEDDKTLTPRGRSIISNTPLGRFGDPLELLGPIVLLISDAGSFLHGTTIAVDGGFAIYSGVGPLDEKRSV